MALKYQKADRTTQDLLKEVMHSFHHCLGEAGVRIGLIVVTDDSEVPKDVLKLGGYACAATVHLETPARRIFSKVDAIIKIDGARWEDYDTDERKALLDHELEHLQVMRESGGICTWDSNKKVMIGEPLIDCVKRPRLKMRLHDWHIGGFRSVVDRWKGKALEVQAVRALQDDDGQYCFGWEGAPKPPAPEPEEEDVTEEGDDA